MTEDQCYWYERGLYAGKNQAAEAQGYKEAYFALLETITKNEAMLPRQTILTMPQRTWVGLTDEEIDLLEELYAPPVHPDFVNDADHCLELIRHVEAKLKEKNT